MIRAASILLLLIWNLHAYGQCNLKNNTFQAGEYVSYNVYYKIGFLWFDAAYATFSISDTTYQSQKAYSFKSYGATRPNYDWIYKVRDNFSSVANANTLKPLYFNRNTSEGSYKVNNTYKFNYHDTIIYSSIYNSKIEPYSDTLKLESCTFDVLTAIYACRLINIATLKINNTIPLKMIIDNKFHNLHLRYLGKENAALEDGSVYNCHKFSVLMVEGTIFSGGEDVHVWISDDKAKIPVRIEAKILVGSIIAQLNEINNNKWPLNSCIKNKLSE